MYNDVVNINTKNGNAVVISEDDYNGLLETLYLSNDPKVKNEIITGKNTPLEDCVDESEIDW